MLFAGIEQNFDEMFEKIWKYRKLSYLCIPEREIDMLGSYNG